MPARTGAEFLDRLSRTRTHVEIQGETLKGGIPRAQADLVKRAQAYKLTADASFGMLGRTGDYLNSALMALASAKNWFAQSDAGFADNITRYYQ